MKSLENLPPNTPRQHRRSHLQLKKETYKTIRVGRVSKKSVAHSAAWFDVDREARMRGGAFVAEPEVEDGLSSSTKAPDARLVVKTTGLDGHDNAAAIVSKCANVPSRAQVHRLVHCPPHSGQVCARCQRSGYLVCHFESDLQIRN
jgi:hypothetical protein